MTRYSNFLWLFALLLFLPTDGYAPCVVFTPPEEELNGTGQRAFIAYNPQTQRVDLVPSINLTGEASEFAIVIPTPSIPKLDTVDRRIFRELNDLTLPVTRWRGGGGSSGCNVFTTEDSDSVATFDSAGEAEGVTVISEQEVGAFDTVILTADNPMALTDWLDEHGYHHSIDDNAILQNYINQKWVFTAMRLSAQFQDGRRRRAQFFDATIDPILLTYTAERLIYPLRLTSISAREGADVTVYILTPNKMHFPSAKVEYANWITDSEHDAIRLRYPTLGSFIGESRYLTRLRRSFARTEMDIDFELVRHQDNQEFRRVRYMGFTSLPDILLLGLMTTGYFVWRRIQPFRRWSQTGTTKSKEIN
ncbi:DUF2330 domain-containing protein [Candidatus Poribacteria bacterium]|nr:DUF2330 domain-containing protein [Candidatus Poribacteria bacterium]